MSKVYLYAIVAGGVAGAGPGLATGVSGLPIRRVRIPGRGVVALVSALPGAFGLTPRRLAEHHGVVEAAARLYRAVLPARAGSLWPSVAALRAAVAAERGLTARLARVRDASQYDLWLDMWNWKAPAQPLRRGPGARWMTTRAAREAAARQARGGVARLVHHLCREARAVEVVPAEQFAAGRVAALLVPRDAAPDESALVRFQTRHPELRLRLSGPWAPYAFAEKR